MILFLLVNGVFKSRKPTKFCILDDYVEVKRSAKVVLNPNSVHTVFNFSSRSFFADILISFLLRVFISFFLCCGRVVVPSSVITSPYVSYTVITEKAYGKFLSYTFIPSKDPFVRCYYVLCFPKLTKLRKSTVIFSNILVL